MSDNKLAIIKHIEDNSNNIGTLLAILVSLENSDEQSGAIREAAEDFKAFALNHVHKLRKAFNG